MTRIELAQVTKLVDLIEQTLAGCLDEKIISPLDGAILAETAHCLEAGYQEWVQTPRALVRAVGALSHILGELAVHKELNLGLWSSRSSPGMKSLEWAEEGAQRELSADSDARQSWWDEENGARSCVEVLRLQRRLQ